MADIKVGACTAMAEKKRNCACNIALLMDEVNFQWFEALSLDNGLKVRHLIDLSLRLSPVKLISPVCCEARDVRKRHAEIPVRLIEFTRESRGGQPGVQVLEPGLGDRDFVRADRHCRISKILRTSIREEMMHLNMQAKRCLITAGLAG